MLLPLIELVRGHAVADARGAGSALGFDCRNQVWPVRIVEHAQHPCDEVTYQAVNGGRVKG